MNENKTFNFIDEIFEKDSISDEELKYLIDLSGNTNETIRSDVAKLLVMSNSEIAKNTLIHLSNDDDEIVRVNACDSLSAFSEIEVYEVLIRRLFDDKSDLVKKYALLSIIDIMQDIDVDIDMLKTMFHMALDKTKSIGLKIACFKGLYLLGKEEYLKEIINCLNQNNYQDRCVAINELIDIVNDKNYEEIKASLLNLYAKEETLAVRATIERAFNTMDGLR